MSKISDKVFVEKLLEKFRGDHGRPGPTRPEKSEGLGTKIWPDVRVWVENKWPDFFGTSLGFGVWPGPARKSVCS